MTTDAARPPTISAYYTVGGGERNNTSARHVPFGLSQHSWLRPLGYAQAIWNAREVGFRSHHIRNPFGIREAKYEDMLFDQMLYAEEAGLYKLIEGFVEEVSALVATGDEVTVYLGRVWKNPLLTRMPEIARRKRLERAVSRVLETGAHITVDAYGGEDSVPSGHWSFRWLLDLRAMAHPCRVSIEPRPSLAATHLHALDLVCQNKFWKRSNPRLHPDSKWAAPDSMLTGRISRIIVKPDGAPPDWFTWSLPQIREVLADGHEAQIEPWAMIRAGVSVDEMRQAIAALTPTTPKQPTAEADS